MVVRSVNRSSDRGNGRGRNRAAFTVLKIAVVAPIPRPRVATAARVKTGRRNSMRPAKTRSLYIDRPQSLAIVAPHSSGLTSRGSCEKSRWWPSRSSTVLGEAEMFWSAMPAHRQRSDTRCGAGDIRRHGTVPQHRPTAQDLGTLIRPSQRLLLFSSQEYSIISQSGLSVNVRVFVPDLVKVLGSSTITS